MSAASVLKLHRDDTVVVAIEPLKPGFQFFDGIVARERIPPGHKIALCSHQSGDPVRRYGEVIGFAKSAIVAGEHIHEHNLEVGDVANDYAFCSGVKPTIPAKDNLTFQGIRRSNGQTATRNYIGILTSVNCSAHVANMAAKAFEKNPMIGIDPLADFPNVDGVVALTHTTGCGMGSGEPLQLLRRVLGGYARHANFSHIIVVGLGCEVNQLGGLVKEQGLDGQVHAVNIQTIGGMRKTVERVVEFVREFLHDSNRVKRESVPASELCVALICGGSDGYSGISANPALGAASDILVAQGGTVILSETPETYGAEHLLTRRAITQDVGEKLIERMRWWHVYTAACGVSMNANPSPGNKLGGITTILEKSLGALSKGGSTNLMDVVEYAEPVRSKGLVFMDAPGYDPVQVTGQIAGGANLVAFTTGRGSVFGSKPAPTLKLATTSRIYEHMIDDMDIDCGTVLDGQESIEECGQRIMAHMLRVASGEKSKSEASDIGAAEFAPWIIGAVI